GKGNMAPDNGIAAHEPARGIHQVHGAPFALAQACRFAEQLGHHVTWVRAPGETVPVVAVRADRVVIRSKRGDGSDRNGLFADIEVQETGNFCESVHFRRFFFEPTDQQHLPIEEEYVAPVHTWHYHDKEPSRLRKNDWGIRES